MRNSKPILKILKTAGIFLLAVSLLSACFISCYLQGENFLYQDGRERDESSGKLTFLICGASYTLFGIRPDIINARSGVNAYNLAGTLLTIKGRYTLVAKELERNPVHTVIIEVSPDTLIRDRAQEGVEGDLPMLGRLNTAEDRWAYFRESFTLAEWPEVYYDLLSKGIESALRLIDGTYTTTNQNMTAGYFTNPHADKPIPTNYADIFRLRELPETVVEENVEWLEKLVELCKSRCGRVCLVTAPQSKAYNCMYANLDFFQDWFTAFAEAHGIPYFNFNLAKQKLEMLPDETCFYDETHLNYDGGEVFSTFLIDVLNAYWDKKPTDYLFFNSYQELTIANDFYQK